MLKQLVNECLLTLDITTEGPLLVKSGHATAHGADMTPVLTYRNGQEQVFLPGSSLKGVFRSHLEKVIRTLNKPAVCVPYDKTFCGDRLQRKKKNLRANEEIANWQAYQESCPACRLFGSTFFTGRLAIDDAYLDLPEGAIVEQYTEHRDGVAIDRFSGGAAGKAKFDMEVVRAGVTFSTELYLRNFENWQLGGLLLLVQDLEDALLRIGSGRSRGLGKVRGHVEQVTIQYLQPLVKKKKATEVWGLGKFPEVDTRYGATPDDTLTLTDAPEATPHGIRSKQIFQEESLATLKEHALRSFVTRIQAWPPLA